MDMPDPMWNLLHLLEVMEGEEFGDVALPAQGLDVVDDPGGALGVKSQGGLIEGCNAGLLD